MAAVLRQLADAVTALLVNNESALLTTANYAAAFPPPATASFTAQRVYLPNYDLADSPGLQLFILGLGQSIDVKNGTRGDTFDTYVVKIAVYRQIDRDSSNGQPTESQMDAMADLVEAIIDLIKSNKFINNNTAAWNVIENDLVYDPIMLDQKNTFMTVISIHYQCFSD